MCFIWFCCVGGPITSILWWIQVMFWFCKLFSHLQSYLRWRILIFLFCILNRKLQVLLHCLLALKTIIQYIVKSQINAFSTWFSDEFFLKICYVTFKKRLWIFSHNKILFIPKKKKYSLRFLCGFSANPFILFEHTVGYIVCNIFSWHLKLLVSFSYWSFWKCQNSQTVYW
jgi:hypothetical protein